MFARGPLYFSVYAIAAAFSTYFSMYAFRKPFAAGEFPGELVWPWVGVVSYKSVLIISQVLGYCASKFIGIRVVSEAGQKVRAWMIVKCIGVAWGALFLFAVVPSPWNALCLFLNGLPLGLVWGLVFSFLEGRQLSEVLGAGLSASYIVASGVVKALGRALIQAGVPEEWMPFVTGLVFVLPLGVSVRLLSQLPPPTLEDERSRTRRAPMDSSARWAFVAQYLPGILALTMLYVVLTAYRDFRDNFAVEIWGALGFRGAPEVLAIAELPIAFLVLVSLALLFLIRDNRTALFSVHVLMASGTTLIGLCTWGYVAKLVGPAFWMIGVGLGLYLAYVPYGCMLFDRLLAVTGTVGTAGFLIYVTDAFGYLGSVVLLFYKDLFTPQLSWIMFFVHLSIWTSAIGSVGFALSWLYFRSRSAGSDSKAKDVL